MASVVPNVTVATVTCDTRFDVGAGPLHLELPIPKLRQVPLHKAVVTITRPCMFKDPLKIRALWVIMGKRPLTVDIQDTCFIDLRIPHVRGLT
eukprot:14936817-Heterocapsa_arctica.AAC.1